ncbi:DinB family protein [Paenibacillus sp. N3.4]|uniref:DinB family protein n=1 Tax=Paenibacillus sp. N3.4 TaxID=2603222 RepID=UPI0011C814C8|nr:DinB family protein [Paenibacillus sp. N3.4]TXK85298.1 damage-inducible protein DinB [Paenibacillus sp. N3.4]
MSNITIKNYEYHVWANKRVFQRLRELPEEILQQEIGNVFPTLHAGLVHIYRVDTVWFSAMKGSTYEQTKALLGGIEEKTSGKSLEQLETVYDELANMYRAFLSSDVDLLAVKEYPHPVHGILYANTEDLIQHIVNHGTYHRGNISSMLRQLGYAGASSDYVFFLYEWQAGNNE